MKPIRGKLKKYLIPHEGNDYKPHLLRPRAIIFLCTMMVAVEMLALFGSPHILTRSRLFGVIVVNALVDGTNAGRVTDNLPALTVNPLLQAAAEEKASDMAKNNYFAHTSPAGLTPWHWFENVGYVFNYAGENLAVNFSDSQDVTDAWMNSPEHRANILNANYTDIGIATASGTYEGQPVIFVVELFGTPAAVNIAVTPVVHANPTNMVVTAKPKPQPTAVSIVSVPTIVSTTLVRATSSQAASVAVRGASTEILPIVTSTVPQLALPMPASISPNSKIVPQNNPIQEAFASPRKLTNDFYLLIIIVMLGALALNFFIKIRIQHPQLIFNGVFVIAIAALCVVLNQHQLLSHAVIF